MSASTTVSRFYEVMDHALHPERGWQKTLLYLIRLGLMTAAIAGGCILGSWMTVPEVKGNLYLVWPPVGLGLAVVLLGGYRYLPGILLGMLLWSVTIEADLLLQASVACVYIVSTAVTVFLLRSLMRIDVRLERIYDVGAFFLVGTALNAMISAGLGTLVYDLHGVAVNDDTFTRIFWPWLLADIMGILVVAPFCMVWYSRTKVALSNRQVVEVVVWLCSLLFLGWVVFVNWAPTDTLRYPLELAMFPIMAWAAVRFGQRGATTGVVLLAIVAVRELTWVLGPEQRYISQSPSFLWMFVGIISSTSMFIAAVMTEHRRREEASSENEKRLRAFVDAMPDIAYVLSSKGDFLEIFVPRDVLRYRDVRHQLLNRTVRDAWSPGLATLFQSTIEEALERGQTRNVEYPQQVLGETRWFEGRVTPMSNEEGVFDRVVWVAFEITLRKETEDRIRHRDTLLEGVTQAQSLFLAMDEQQRSVENVLQIIGERMGVDRVYVLEIPNMDSSERSPDINRPEFYAWVKAGHEFPVSENQIAWTNWPALIPGWVELLRRDGLVVGNREDFASSEQRVMQQYSIHSILGVPVWMNDKYWGLLGVADCQGRRQWTEADISALRIVSGSLGAFIVNRRAKEILVHAKEAADSASQAKSEFLALISHEIRTPLNAILGFADLLRQSLDDPAKQEYVTIIRRGGNALLELINTLLDFSKIESRGLELEVAPFSLEPTAMEALEMVLVRAREKDIEVRYEPETDWPDTFLGDATRLRQVLMNLLNNAVKFTDSGSVVLKKRIRERRNGRYEVEFSVEDTGIGIPRDKIDRLFQPFSQVDSSTTRRHGGTGLGLVICKRLIERMGGTISVHSEEGKGSRFIFRIPLEGTEQQPDGQAEPTREEALESSFASDYPLRILLFDNDAANLQLEQEMLTLLGYEPQQAENAGQAREQLSANEFDLLLIDTEVPAPESGALLEMVRRRPTKVVAMAAFGGSEEGEWTRARDVFQFLEKPVSVDKLKQMLRSVSQSFSV